MQFVRRASHGNAIIGVTSYGTLGHVLSSLELAHVDQFGNFYLNI